MFLDSCIKMKNSDVENRNLTTEYFVEISFEETYYNRRCTEVWEKHVFSNNIKKIPRKERLSWVKKRIFKDT